MKIADKAKCRLVHCAGHTPTSKSEVGLGSESELAKNDVYMVLASFIEILGLGVVHDSWNFVICS